MTPLKTQVQRNEFFTKDLWIILPFQRTDMNVIN